MPGLNRFGEPCSPAILDETLLEDLRTVGLSIYRSEQRSCPEVWYVSLDLRPGCCRWGPFPDAATALVEGVRAMRQRIISTQAIIASICEECGQPILVSYLDHDRHCDECIRVHAVE